MVTPYSKTGIIFPQVITIGIITRRAIELMWLTASNARKNRIGSELKSMVCALPGYAIVGADVDWEELWISRAMGDAKFGEFGLHGATALGWITLEGSGKHSNTARIFDLSRDQAKVSNYHSYSGSRQMRTCSLNRRSNSRNSWTPLTRERTRSGPMCSGPSSGLARQ